MIPLLGKVTATRRRFDADTFTNYRPNAPTYTDTDITVSAIPAPKEVMERLPNGVNSSHVIVLVSYGQLQTAGDDQRPDHVIYTDGHEYQVYELQEATAFLGQPRSLMAVCIRLQALEVGQ